MKYKLDICTEKYRSSYAFDTWRIAIAKAPDKKGVIKLYSSLQGCRESVCLKAARALCVDIDDSSKGQNSVLTKADLKFTRIILFSKVYRTYGMGDKTDPKKEKLVKAREASIQKALYVINSLERNAEWPLTKLYRLESNGRNQKFHPADLFYYAKGSSRWLRAPSLLSLYGILLRAGLYPPVKSKRISSSDGKIFLGLQQGVRATKYPFENYLTAGLYYGLPFLKKLGVIFKDRTIPFNYGTERLGNPGRSISVEGFHKLFNGTTNDQKLFQIVKKHIIDETNKEAQRMKAGR